MKFYFLLGLTVCSLAYVHFIFSANERGRVLRNVNSCPEPVQACPEGEAAYFQKYPDVDQKWKPGEAHYHWKQYGKAKGRQYSCRCQNSERIDSEP